MLLAVRLICVFILFLPGLYNFPDLSSAGLSPAENYNLQKIVNLEGDTVEILISKQEVRIRIQLWVGNSLVRLSYSLSVCLIYSCAVCFSVTRFVRSAEAEQSQQHQQRSQGINKYHLLQIQDVTENGIFIISERRRLVTK